MADQYPAEVLGMLHAGLSEDVFKRDPARNMLDRRRGTAINASERVGAGGRAKNWIAAVARSIVI